ncbi:MAG: hypothetical protein AB7F86_00245 [Bdellovibrionales bacterium]
MIFILGALLYFALNPEAGRQLAGAAQTNKKACQVDADCVADSCCHSNDTINSKFAPVCQDIMCTADCSGRLDCGQNEPACVNQTCGIRPKSSLKDVTQ